MAEEKKFDRADRILERNDLIARIKYLEEIITIGSLDKAQLKQATDELTDTNKKLLKT